MPGCHNTAAHGKDTCNVHTILASSSNSLLRDTVVLLTEAGIQVHGVNHRLPCVGIGCDTVRIFAMAAACI